jgi:RNA-directed DNA polymerase
MTKSPAIPVSISFAECHRAFLKARRGKRPSVNSLRFQLRWIDRLCRLRDRLQSGNWQPAPARAFIVNHPKTREIHAPDFSDRIVHHWLVGQLEPLFEPGFIHDSYANRSGKGSHAAVDRLQSFMRSRNGQGWYMQLDIHNFFNSIHRPTLYARITRCLDRSVHKGRLENAMALMLRSLCHKLLATKVREVVDDPAAAARLPPHKRLANAPAGCGIPVGNLTSQFFANVYLDALDQFVKHQLRCRHYVRYVDDFVLLADDPATLDAWREAIVDFLRDTLHLTLKQNRVEAGVPVYGLMQPLTQGIDFLGYRVFTHYRWVRPRVVRHCRAKLTHWMRQHARVHSSPPQDVYLRLKLNTPELVRLRAVVASYWGHFAHANSVRLRRRLWVEFPALSLLYAMAPDGSLQPRWIVQGVTLSQQIQAVRQAWPCATVLIQEGNRFSVWYPWQDGRNPALKARIRDKQTGRVLTHYRTTRQPYVVAVQTGWLRHGTRRREVREWWVGMETGPDGQNTVGAGFAPGQTQGERKVFIKQQRHSVC